MYSKPVLFIRKRISGVVKAIDEIIDQIETDGVESGPLIDLIGGNKISVINTVDEFDFNDKLAALRGEDKDVLLSKEANREQLEIAKRIELYNAVLVQRPPGTGKTHTIANLMGHFLAQGKSILVTSHTKKALSVLKDKIPTGLQSLCVSILDDSNKDLVRSVDGITEGISRHSSIELFDKVERLKEERNKLLYELNDVRKRIVKIKFREFESIVLSGKSYSPIEAASFVNKNSENLSYIPGKVSLYKPLPVSIKDLDVLYKTNDFIKPKDEIEMGYKLPNPDSIMAPFDFKSKIVKLQECNNKLNEIQTKIGVSFEIDSDNNQILVNQEPIVNQLNIDGLKELSSLLNNIGEIDDYLVFAILDGIRGGGYKDVWEQLLNQIKDTSNFAEEIISLVSGKQIFVDESLDIEILKNILEELGNHFENKKKISKLERLFHKSWGEVIDKTSINGKQINSKEDCNIILNYITLEEKRKLLGFLWNGLIFKHGGHNYSEFGDEPERICLKRSIKIKMYLNWYDTTYKQLIKAIEKAGINKDIIFNRKEFNTEIDELKNKIYIITNILPLYIKAIENYYIEQDKIKQLIAKSELVLNSHDIKDSIICLNIAVAIEAKDTEAYEIHFNRLVTLYTKYHYLNERNRIINIIRKDAPDWATHIENRIGLHGHSKIPKEIENAWKWKQFAAIINEITSEPFEQLLQKSVSLNLELKHITANLSENLAWFNLLVRTEKDIDKKQALQGWKLTVKKIGKGTGKNAPKLKREAQKLMAKCQTAVPAWIMTVNKALESLDPKTNKFDIVIVDEASQSDISSLAIMYLAKKIIIVGDDEQVSPSAVGIDLYRVNALSSMYISGVIPNSHLYDMKTSLYDIAKTTFPQLMLREHFRCVPNIIGYSNKLSYEFKIKPLRDDSSSDIKPATISYRVEGSRHISKKVNNLEAETIVSLMLSCMEQPEYSTMTFGAISLLGDEQAKLINQIALEKISPKEYEKRAILCGNSSQFQGDERDVIFLSLVDNNEEDGPLRIVGEGIEKSTKQRYNVAVSRAKNQLWVIHSLDITKDLKSGDMRRDLIEYVTNPRAFNQRIEEVDTYSESPFERAVCRSLISGGYNIVQQWCVGSYRIDIVAICGENKVAIECDGDRYHYGDEKIREDMERQTILERLGWTFVRIRGSEYYSNPEKTIERVFAELDSYNIFPEIHGGENIEIDSSENELLSRVKIRSAQILNEWKNKKVRIF